MARWGHYKLCLPGNPQKHTALKELDVETEIKIDQTTKSVKGFSFSVKLRQLPVGIHSLAAAAVPQRSAEQKPFWAWLVSEFISCSSLIGHVWLLPFLHGLTAEATVHRGIWLDGETGSMWVDGEAQNLHLFEFNLLNSWWREIDDINETIRNY